MAPLSLRDAAPDDLTPCHAIYAHHVRHGTASFEETPPTLAEFAARHADIRARGLPYLVAERDGILLGYAYAAPYRARSAYRHTLENSIYVAPEAGRQGVGHALLGALLARCEAGPWRQMVAVIGDSANAASIALHARCGFRHVGTLEAVGFKFGRWIDSVLMQRPLGEGGRSLPAAP